MVEIRLAKDDEVDDLKQIWKICFGDDDSYIDFHFAHQYKENERAVLLYKDVIAAMATMIDVTMVMANGDKLEASMLYAIATLPHYQGKGFSTQIMEYCNQYLIEKGKALSILVPAEASLFDFYNKRGYTAGFYNRKISLAAKEISQFKTNIKDKDSQEIWIEPVTASDYNKRRRSLLEGRPYIDYYDQEIDYQKKISCKFGADLYGINSGDIKGCAIVERIDNNEVLIKEILMPDHLIGEGIRKIKQLLPAKNYVVRLPSYSDESLGGEVEPFGMIKLYGVIDDLTFPDKQGYLGIAYD